MRLPVIVLILSHLLSIPSARCQTQELMVQGQTGKLYLIHTVVAKENWYSVGRLYNTSPQALAPYNHRTLGQPLAIGQTLNIPLTAVNFSQTGTKASGETLIPVIHITQEKEWMYRISVNHNKVPITSLEKWNHINKDQVHPGMHLIVGFLKVKTALSALAAPPHPAAVASTATTPGTAAPKPDSLAGAPAVTVPIVAKTETPPPPVPKPATSNPSSPVPKPTTSNPPPPITKSSTTNPTAPHFDGGIFRSDFSDEGHSASGQAGVFKSTSGWQDGKYYALMNNITVGTVVRVTDPATGKSVYTKVLGQLPDMKESAGLTIRISNAAAAELGLGDGRVTVQVNY